MLATRQLIVAMTLMTSACASARQPAGSLSSMPVVDVMSVVGLYEHGHLSEAANQLRQLLVIAPHDFQLHFMLGNAAYRLHDFNLAAREYKAALSERPDDFEARVSLGFTLFEVGDCRAATAEWTISARTSLAEPLGRAALALGLECVGRVDEADVEYGMAVTLDSRYRDVRSLSIDIRWTRQAVGVVERIARRVAQADSLTEDRKTDFADFEVAVSNTQPQRRACR
jgi:Tfp pilus assembly protein PilF